MYSKLNSFPGALCDAFTACFFLTLWLSPMAFGPEAVRVAFMLILVEFLLMHATAMLDAQKGRSTAGCLVMVGLVSGYLLFFVVASVSFDSTWPLFAFAWLLGGKLFTGALVGRDDLWERHWRNGIWLLSFVAWLVLMAVVSTLPVPRMGMTPEALSGVDALGMSGSLVDYPQKLMLFGAAYFMLLSAAKLSGFNILDFFSDRADGRGPE